MNTPQQHLIAFGPVPSRRLGQSLGINNVTTKACSYRCAYCQVGPTTDLLVAPQGFFGTEAIRAAVVEQIRQVRSKGQTIDYLTFVPNGEPTLDRDLGDSIEALRGLDIPIAVITNGSLLWRPEVRIRLQQADLVSIKVDTVQKQAWHRINHPSPQLSLPVVLDGIRRFAAGFEGTLITDTMLIAGLNDGADSLVATADFLANLQPACAYLAIPTRPPVIKAARATDQAGLVRAHQIFAARLAEVELLTGQETGPFAHSGDARADLLAITAVHPMRESAVGKLLASNGAPWSLVEELLAVGLLSSTEFEGERYYLRPVGPPEP
jgi:wyosine [tRNA(Phe)-imidazoG37] synthetase (radical SAM superfamily)